MPRVAARYRSCFNVSVVPVWQCSYVGGAGMQCGGRTNCANGLNGADCSPDPQNDRHGPHIALTAGCSLRT